MKKSVVVSAFNSLLLVGIAKAEPDDVAATLAVSGTVESSNNGCNVSLDKSAMELGSWDINTLPLQGILNQKTSSNKNIARLEGDNCTSNNGAFIGLKFMGPADQTAGNSFLNTAQGQNAATGVAVSVYDCD